MLRDYSHVMEIAAKSQKSLCTLWSKKCSSTISWVT